MTHAIAWSCPSCKRAGKLVPASLGDPAFWICVNTNCGNLNAAVTMDDDPPATDSPAERERDELQNVKELAETWRWRHEQDTAGCESPVAIVQNVNTSLRLLPLTGIDDPQRIYDVMYKNLDRLARWLIDTPSYPGRPAPREIRAASLPEGAE